MWALTLVPAAGPAAGVHFRIAAGDAVIVAFEGGDPDYPIVVGSFWGPGQAPLSAGTSSVITARNGTRVEISDIEEMVTVATPTGAVVEIATEGITLTSGSSTLFVGPEAVLIDAAEVQISSASALTLQADVVEIEGAAETTVTGTDTTVTGDAACRILAPLVEIN